MYLSVKMRIPPLRQHHLSSTFFQTKLSVLLSLFQALAINYQSGGCSLLYHQIN